MQFDQFADNYEQVLDRAIAVSGEDLSYFAGYKADYLRRVLPPSSSSKVLDFGCGIGLLSGFLKASFPDLRVDGFDLSENCITKVDERLKQQGTFTSRMDDLAHDYGLIVVANVMHHVLPGKRQKLIDELAERMIPGGILSIFEHNPANPATRWIVDRCPFDEDAILLPVRETITYLCNAKLKLKHRDYIVFMPRPLAWFRTLERWLRWLPMGAQYALLAEKDGQR